MDGNVIEFVIDTMIMTTLQCAWQMQLQDIGPEIPSSHGQFSDAAITWIRYNVAAASMAIVNVTICQPTCCCSRQYFLIISCLLNVYFNYFNLSIFSTAIRLIVFGGFQSSFGLINVTVLRLLHRARQLRERRTKV